MCLHMLCLWWLCMIYIVLYIVIEEKNILLKLDNQVTSCGESCERKNLEQISNDSKSSAAVERSSGKRYRKTGTWEDSHEAWQNSGNTIIIFKIYAILFFLQAFYTQLINHQNTHMNISLFIITPKNDELLLLNYIVQIILKIVSLSHRTFM